MPGFSLQVVQDTVSPMLRKLSADMHSVISNFLEETGQEMEGMSRGLVPVRTGYLQSTIYHKVDAGDLSMELGATADYALWVEIGTRRMAAQPYIRPAFDAGQEKLLQALIRGILSAFQ